VTLVGGKQRDALVHRFPLPGTIAQLAEQASGALTPLLAPVEGDYAQWALGTCERIQRCALGRDDLVYVDLNRVAVRYLAEAAAVPGHPIVAALRGGSTNSGVGANLPWFYRPILRGSRARLQPVYEVPPDALAQVACGGLCPGLVWVFGALRMLSSMTLLGGFRQVTYLERLASDWGRLGVEDCGRPGQLLTGRLVGADGGGLYPLDLALGTVLRSALPDVGAPMSGLLAPIVARVRQLDGE
jgi:hypothetical protein